MSTITMGSSQSTKSFGSTEDPSINCGLVDGETPSEFSRSYSADEEAASPNLSVSSEGTSDESETNESPQKLTCGDEKHSRHSAILIFDLDDTLIPTEWIRSTFAAQKHKHATADEVYQVSNVTPLEQSLNCKIDRLLAFRKLLLYLDEVHVYLHRQIPFSLPLDVLKFSQPTRSTNAIFVGNKGRTRTPYIK